MSRRLVCLHGHFYQPPRENPWIEEIEVQDSAAPFHDWNERIAAECYGPNGAARIKTPADRIADIVDNYRHLSFNFGPTLLAWLERKAPDTYRSILEADAISVARRGHGNALGQAYNHAILPLCSERDRVTQVRWGIADFRHRFGREPEGFWLPETAADRATLRTLVDEGIRFTVLSPYQATRVRAPGGEWADATGARFDPARPYRIDVGDDKSIVAFFYDGPIARSLAFGEGLAHGDELVRRIEAGFDPARGHDELLTIAVDGETFGHHKKGGDEVLAAALRQLGAREDLELVNLGQALDRVPVEWEAEIAEGSSWSCAHGLGRWTTDCGCSANGQPGWNQAWRAPLREALDGLRDELGALYERSSTGLLADPWAARDRFIDLVVDPEREDARAWVAREAGRTVDDGELVTALRLCEMQRQAMLMYTSCGWFFAEISGLETVQILRYAARAIQLAREVSGVDLEPRFKEALSRAPSNLRELGDGSTVYERYVLPSVVPLERVAAHHAIASLFEDHDGEGLIFCYRYHVRARRRETSGPATLAVGHIELESLITRERLDATFCVLHFGGSDFRCGLRPFSDGAAQAELERALFLRLDHLSLAQVVREIDRAFTGRDYTLRDLFLDERRRMAHLLLRDTLRRYERDYFEIFEANRRLMAFLREIDSPVPTPLRVAADVGLTHELEEITRRLSDGELSAAEAHGELVRVVDLARSLGARLDLEEVTPRFVALLDGRLSSLLDQPDASAVSDLVEIVDLAQRAGVALDLWRLQNRIWAWAATRRATLAQADVTRLARRLWFDEPALVARFAENREGPIVATVAAPASA